MISYVSLRETQEHQVFLYPQAALLTVDVLEALERSPDPLRIQDVAAKTGLERVAVFRLLTSEEPVHESHLTQRIRLVGYERDLKIRINQWLASSTS